MSHFLVSKCFGLVSPVSSIGVHGCQYLASHDNWKNKRSTWVSYVQRAARMSKDNLNILILVERKIDAAFLATQSTIMECSLGNNGLW